MYFNEWVSSNPLKLKNGKNQEPNVQWYKLLRANLELPKLLKPKEKESKKTLVLDLDETLVHSSFVVAPEAQMVIPIEVEDNSWSVYVQVRPGAKYFLEEVSKYYEVVIYTASISKYAEPLMKQLDPNGVCSYKLFREHWSVCSNIFVKDLLFLGRDLKDTIIIDNSPNSYAFQVQNALPIPSWYSDKSDTALYQLLPILQKLAIVDDVRMYLTSIVSHNKVNYKKAFKILKIDSDFKNEMDDYYDSGREIATSELDEGTKYQLNNPFSWITNRLEEQGSRTIDSTTRIADEAS